MYINKLSDKYNIKILSITFKYYQDNDLIYPPQLILLCKSIKTNDPTEFKRYNCFKLIFTNPSNYNIHVTNNNSIYDITENTQLQTKDYTCSITEIKISSNHYKWEFLFKKESTERGYIRIYADKLQIVDQEHCPDLN